MIDESDFQSQILAHPADLALRLAFADWLEEHDRTDHANFIRWDCERTALLDRFDWGVQHSVRVRTLEFHCNELLIRHADAPWANPAPAPGILGQFRSGFLEWVVCSLRTFLTQLPVLIDRIPLTGVQLTGGVGEFDRLTHDSPFARLAYLSIADLHYVNTDLEAILDSPYLASLRTLDLSNTGTHRRELDRIAEEDSLARLRCLILNENQLRADDCWTLAGRSHLAGLRRLYLSGNQLGNAGVEALAASPLMGRLTHLDLSSNGISSRAVQWLAESPRIDRLQVLHLADNAIFDTGIIALANSPHLADLRFLNLQETDVGDAALESLLNSPLAQRLEYLCISTGEISDALVQRIREHFGDGLIVTDAYNG